MKVYIYFLDHQVFTYNLAIVVACATETCLRLKKHQHVKGHKGISCFWNNDYTTEYKMTVIL